EELIPAPGQGALGIECLAERTEVRALLAGLGHDATAACVRAERQVSLALGGNCTIPLGAYAQTAAQAGASAAGGTTLRLRAIVAAPDGRRMARADCSGPAADPEALGRQAAEELRRGRAGRPVASPRASRWPAGGLSCIAPWKSMLRPTLRRSRASSIAWRASTW